MDKAAGVLIANQIADQRVQRSGPAPRLRLLTELEPGHRVFFGNLADLLLSRRVPQIPITARPAPFWDDVFVPSGAPWSSFMQSMLCHLLLMVLFLWGQSRVWVPVKLFLQQDAFHRSITYYPPTQSFPAVGGRASSVRARSQVKHTAAHQPAHQPAIPVTPQQKPSLVTPPDIKQATARLPNSLRSHAVTPMVPFSTTAGPRRNAWAGPSGVVAPPPELNQEVDRATVRRPALPQASAVAPAPELGEPSAGRPMKAPNTGGLRVVPPPPSVQNAGNSARAGRLSSGLSSLSGAGPNVVPPPPAVQGAGNAARDARFGAMAGASSQVVPPPPLVQNAGNSARGGRLSSGLSPLSGAGPNVVPPPPALQGAGNAARDARFGAMAGAGSQVVPPPPSVQGSGGNAGGARLGSLSGAGSQVVPPPPSVQGSGGSAGGARLNSLSGAGSEVVPPPPSVQGSGGSAGGKRLGSLSGAGSGVLPPPPSVEGAGNSGAGGPAKLLDPMDPLPVAAASPTPAINQENKPTAEELPLGLLGVVFVAPGTSFFSNFEVFVAKRRGGKNVGKNNGKNNDKNNDQMQLIKLVYEFLPYQRRLSEYNLNNVPARVIKLHVTPDPSCNEPLGQIIQPPHTDPTLPAPEYPELPAALRSSDLNAVLPCYRTTADDFQKAMSRAH